MLRELVDVCKPYELVREETDRLKDNGFIVIGQHGGGDYGSTLVYAKAESEEEEGEVMRMHNEHMAFVYRYLMGSEQK